MLALSRGECQPRPPRSRAYHARVGMRSARGRRRAGGRLRRGLAGFTALDLVRALWLGTIVGLAAGAVAILFFELLELSTRYVLTGLTGYAPPESFGQGGAEAEGPTRRWALPLVAGLGGLASGVVLFLLVPNARTHGMDEAIDAFHRHGGRLPWRGVPAMLFGSVLTIGSGGAAGAEGPAAGIGSGLGSAIAGRLGLSAAERRRALVAGMGAGMGAVFRAPLGGAMMAVESLYRHDFEADAVVLSLISSIVAFAVFGAWAGYDPIFGGTAGFSFTNAGELPYYLALGVACGLLGILYARGLDGVHAFFRRLTLPPWAKPALGGLLVGAVGMAAPEAIHIGYGWVQRLLRPEQVTDFSFWLLAALPVLRIATAALTVGSGAAGGVFAPGMVAGGMLGALFWRLFQDLPGFPEEPGPLVVIGMIAVFGSIAHAPLAMMLMVAEMTGNLSLLAPAMVTVAVATLLSGNVTIYHSQVATRAESAAHRHRFAYPLLDALPAQRALAPLPAVPADATVAEALAALDAASSERGALVDGAGRPAGELNARTLRDAPDANAPVAPLATGPPAAIPADTPLDEALDRLAGQQRHWLPVTDGADGPLLGAIDGRAVVRAWRQAVRQQVRPLSPVDEEVGTLELTVAAHAPARGRRLAEAALPPGVRVLTVERGGHAFAPAGDTLLRAGDRLTLAVPRGQRAATLALILGE